jgi:hypothetical protein
MQVSLDKFGSEVSVNPKYVTAIQPKTFKTYSPGEEDTYGVELWVVGHAGYGTFSINLREASVDAVRKHLNRAERRIDGGGLPE